MRKYFFLISIFFLFSGRLHSMCMPIYPFELAYCIYSGENRGEVQSLFHANVGVRIEKLKIAYFDFAVLADIFSNVSKSGGMHAEMLQKDAVEFLRSSVNFPSMKGLPLSASIFFGKYDELSSDSIVREYVKSSAPISVFKRGYPADVFRPDLAIEGLGFALYGVAPNGFYSGFYTSWNTKTQSGFAFANDFRLGFATHTFIFESFVGFISHITAEAFKLRSGMMASFDMDGYKLLFKMGFANMPIQKINFKKLASYFYMLAEPSVVRDLFNMTVSFFLSSPFHLPKDLEKIGLRGNNFVGLNLLFGFGNLEIKGMNGGVSLLTALSLPNVADVTPFTFSIAPFFTFIASEFEFTFKMPFNPLFYKDLRRSIVFEFSVKAMY